jgi:uncharacterized protein
VRILVFAKAPVPGRVKTRLIPALGADGAARLAAEMLERTVNEAVESGVGAVELCADPAPNDPAWIGHRPLGVEASDQGGGDLGDRLARAAERVVAGGERVMLIGADCPDLTRHRLAAAAAALGAHDAVIHPAQDGGYALLGLARFDPSLFAKIAWSTSGVAAATIARIEALGWSLHVGETLRDIDEPADLL